MDINNLTNHLKTIRKHRWEVMKYCFKIGIPFRGITHDLSKYSITELKIAKYYKGTYSPHDAARSELGYSPSWYHHRNRNKHHWEYWIDSVESVFRGVRSAVKMPYKYVIEMFCDFVGAGKTYMKENWSASAPLEYHLRTKKNRVYHRDTLMLLDFLFTKLDKLGEDEFLKYYKKHKHLIREIYNLNDSFLTLKNLEIQ